MAAAINRIAYIWLVADEVLQRALDLTVGRLLKHGNCARRLSNPK